MRKSFKITGSDAVRLAERDRLEIFCHANPQDDGGKVTIGEARGIVREDPSLVYVLVHKDGWWDGQRVSEMRGYDVHDYFSPDGMYLGPDDDGVEPTWIDA